MILCQRNDGLWFLSHRVRAELPGVALRVGNGMPRDPSFENIPPAHAVWSGYTEALADFVFFPTLRFDGMRVFPESWASDSAEPVLRVWTSQHHFERPVRTTQEYHARMAELRAKGWAWDEREGGTRWVHVDELDKLEGPPPVGVF